MKEFVRAMIVPFFAVLFPAVWYINRNVMTEQLYPYTEPTPELLALSLGIAVVCSLVFSMGVALFRQQRGKKPHEIQYRQRVFQPDNTALAVFFSFMWLVFVWALVEMGGIGPSWIRTVLQVLILPFAFPLLILGPFALRWHWAVILGLICCVLWMSVIGIVVSDIAHDRPLPVLSR